MRPPPDKYETLTRRPQHHLRHTTLIIIFSLIGVVALVAFAILGLYLYTLSQTTRTVIRIDDETRTIQTRALTVDELLQDQNINVQDGDRLSLSPDTPIDEGIVIEVERGRNVTVTVDGETQVHRTTHRNPAGILSELGVTLAADDRITVDGTLADPFSLDQWPVPANQINIRRALTLTVTDDGTEQTIRTNGETVGDALYDAEIDIYLADGVDPPLNTPVTSGMTIAIIRAVPVTVIADGTTLETRTRSSTVAGLLADAGVSLMGLDYSIPDESVIVQPGMSVRVIRVAEDVVGETEIIPFENVSQGDSSLELDQTRLIQAGENGIQRTDIVVRYENGVEVSRETVGTQVVREPQNRVIAFGTGIVVRTVDTEQGPREYWRKVRMLTTSYHPAALGGDNITATGRILTKGIVGIDPTVIPYGTEVYVPGYGVGIAADTGGPRSTRLWIDLGYDDENWVPWSQYTDVYILTPIPESPVYILPD
jgi:uncharacterized protein YabE (DUF348 family)